MMFLSRSVLFVAAIVSTSVSAFAPQMPASSRTMSSSCLFSKYGKYDGLLWDNEAKKDVYSTWDPNAPRSAMNFNPFETWEGNSPDASGFYPGENGYKDPMRGDASYAIMLAERAEAEERAANPKPGDVPGCAGCRN